MTEPKFHKPADACDLHILTTISEKILKKSNENLLKLALNLKDNKILHYLPINIVVDNLFSNNDTATQLNNYHSLDEVINFLSRVDKLEKLTEMVFYIVDSEKYDEKYFDMLLFLCNKYNHHEMISYIFFHNKNYNKAKHYCRKNISKTLIDLTVASLNNNHINDLLQNMFNEYSKNSNLSKVDIRIMDVALEHLFINNNFEACRNIFSIISKYAIDGQCEQYKKLVFNNGKLNFSPFGVNLKRYLKFTDFYFNFTEYEKEVIATSDLIKMIKSNKRLLVDTILNDVNETNVNDISFDVKYALFLTQPLNKIIKLFKKSSDKKYMSTITKYLVLANRIDDAYIFYQQTHVTKLFFMSYPMISCPHVGCECYYLLDYLKKRTHYDECYILHMYSKINNICNDVLYFLTCNTRHFNKRKLFKNIKIRDSYNNTFYHITRNRNNIDMSRCFEYVDSCNDKNKKLYMLFLLAGFNFDGSILLGFEIMNPDTEGTN